MQYILEHLKKLGDNKQLKRQSVLALELFFLIVSVGDLPRMAKSALNLWKQVIKNRTLDDKAIVSPFVAVQENLRFNQTFIDLEFGYRFCGKEVA